MNNLSTNQKLFVKNAEQQGLKVDYDYSGRGMYGEVCPSVIVDSIGEFGTKAKINSDNMGKSYVIYCPR